MWSLIESELGGTFAAVPAPVALLRLTCAIVLASMIGLEREWHNRAAGLRTHILVSVAACLFVLLGMEISALEFGRPDQQQHDPLRMIEAVTAGVAFLAAGMIFTARGKVQNVTTGASLWLAGAVGLGCGAGRELLAAMATVIVVAVLVLLRLVEPWLHSNDD